MKGQVTLSSNFENECTIAKIDFVGLALGHIVCVNVGDKLCNLDGLALGSKVGLGDGDEDGLAEVALGEGVGILEGAGLIVGGLTQMSFP